MTNRNMRRLTHGSALHSVQLADRSCTGTFPQVVFLAYHAALDPRVGAYARQLGELGAALSGLQLQAVTRLAIAETVDEHMGEVRGGPRRSGVGVEVTNALRA